MASAPKVQLLLKDRLVQELAFTSSTMRIGRMKENDLVVNNLAVSRFHAVLHLEEGGRFRIEDLGSENGTQVNGAPVDGSAFVAAGDTVTVGKHTIVIGEMATNDPVIPAAPTAASDAWDAAQTYLAIDGKPPAPAPASADPAANNEEPVAVAETKAGPEPHGDGGAAGALFGDAGEPSSLASAEPLGIGADPLEAPIAANAAPALIGPSDSPDPAGAFSFGEDDVDDSLAPGLDDGVEPEVATVVAEATHEEGDLLGEALADPAFEAAVGEATGTSEPAYPSGEHTALFDFGGSVSEPTSAASAEVPVVEEATEEAAEETEAKVRDTHEPRPAEGWSPHAQSVTPARPSAGLYAGWIVQRGSRLDRVVAWESETLIVGRSDSCDIVLPEAGVSREHTRFVTTDDGFYVEDLGSVNGTWVDGEAVVGPWYLKVGDVVKIDEFELTFILDHQPVGSEVRSPVHEASDLDASPYNQTQIAGLGADPGEPGGSPAEEAEIMEGLETVSAADDEKEELAGVAVESAEYGSTQARMTGVETELVKVEIEVPRGALPPYLRLAMEEAGEDALRLPAEVRIRLR